MNQDKSHKCMDFMMNVSENMVMLIHGNTSLIYSIIYQLQQ